MARPRLLLLSLAALLAHCAGDGASCSRATPCANFGTCELHTGACSCPLGFGGRLCERTLLAACAVTTAARAPPRVGPPAMLCASGRGAPEHGQEGLKSCECLRQCVAHEAAGLAEHGLCFERPGGPTRQHSAFPAEDEPGVVYRTDSRPEAAGAPPLTRDDYLRLQAERNLLEGRQALPPAACNASCSGEGVCLRDVNPPHAPQCWCGYGQTGDACELQMPDACLNACSGRGACIRGFCSCEMGYFGIDCSIDLRLTDGLASDPVVELDMPEGDGELLLLANATAADGVADASLGVRATAVALPRGVVQQRLRPLIYVYELPTWLSQAFEIDRWACQTERGMYAAYWTFFEQLLRDPHVRTHDPWRANLFYVPAFTYAVTSNSEPPHDYIRRVLRFVAAEYPGLWGRRRGRDHVVWATGDRGVCPLPADLAPLTWLVHYGQTRASQHDRDGAAGAPAPPGATCFDAQHGVVAPPLVREAAAMANATYNGTAYERPTLLFFAGGMRLGHEGYSQGVRQRVWELFHNRSADGYDISEHVHDMAASMRAARFCLTPAGHGWGIRIVHAMACGCVPLIVQDGVHQPFDDVLPYHLFSIRLPQADIERLDDVLRDVSPAELRALQAGVRRFHRAFIWSGPEGEGEAYLWVIRSLERRVHSLMAGF